ncbi:S8 family serine peptidase [Streptomyces sp. NPDC050619]|uniref:S8 family peptidase n=1 Tax=Streptomyces sp. NPDC050619 TaxID=3157214 RepID=UPI0034378A7B
MSRSTSKPGRGLAVLAGLVSLALLPVAEPAAATDTASPGTTSTGTTSSGTTSSGTTSSGTAQRVIVMLRDTRRAAAHDQAVADGQAAVVSDLRDAGATRLSKLNLLNAVAATVQPAALAQLRADKRVAAVVPDRLIAMPDARRATADAVQAAGGTTATAPACPKNPASPLIEPEALHLTKSDTAQRIATGKGVKVAFFADGIDVNNPEFLRPDGTHVITDYQDFSGNGTNDHTDGREAFGDAGSIAAQGNRTYDLSEQLRHTKVAKGCTVQVRGVAPGAELMAMKAYGETGGAWASTLVRSIQYAVDHGADILSQSFGGNGYPDAATDPVRMADRAAVAAGVTVVASSGDSGVSGTIGSPASDPQVIGVGGTNAYRLTAQAYGYRGYVSDNIAALSSGGTTLDNKLVDLVAPGSAGLSPCTVGPHWTGCAAATNVFHGTSQSAPFVAGAAALVIQAYKETHLGARPSPALVKRILTGTATDLRVPASEQGAGLLNTTAAVKAARAVDAPGGDARSTALVPSAGQLNLTGQPGSTQRTSVALANTANRPQRVTMTSRTLGDRVFRTDRTLTVGKPQNTKAVEGPLAAPPVTFEVPRGTPLLDARMVWPGTEKTGHFVLFLIDPDGRLAQVSYNFEEYGTYSNYQYVDVHDPRPGTWTAKLVWNNGRMDLQHPLTPPGSYRGAVKLRLTGYRYASAGVPAQTRLVPAGGTAEFGVQVPIPDQAGDAPFSLQFTSGTGSVLSLPVARRALIPADPAPGHSTSFTGTVTGGVGRDVGQSLGFYLDLPPGHRGLSIDLTIPDPAKELVEYLVSPSGQVLARDTDRNFSDSKPTKYVNLSANRPAAGRWTVIVALINPASGKEFSQRITGRVRLDSATASAPGLPDSPDRTIKRGSSVTVPIRVPNPGPAERTMFLDPRLDTMREVPVQPFDSDTATLPDKGTLGWFVPSHTTSLKATATGSFPVDLTLGPWTRSPSTVAPAGTGDTTTVTATADQLAAGDWITEVDQPAPFTDGHLSKGTAKLSLTATTQPTDPDAQASTGDLWDLKADWEGLDVPAGKTAEMTLTLKPTAPVGTVVRGVVYVDTITPMPGMGSEVIGIPYVYTVG